MQQIKIAIAEKHNILRASIVDYLRGEDQFEVLFDTAGGLDLLDQVSNSTVDVLFLSTSLLDYRGENALKIIHESDKVQNLKIILFSNETGGTYMKEMVRLGANSILKKTVDSEMLVDCIEKVYKEGYYFNKYFTKEVLESALNGNSK